MAYLRLEEKDFYIFLEKVQLLVNEDPNGKIEQADKLRKEVKEIVDAWIEVRNLMFERNKAYETYKKISEENPVFAIKVYNEIYLERKKELEKSKKRLEKKLYE